ncbi:MAG: LptF/LptG family permease, partial [Bacteroidota bacterium]
VEYINKHKIEWHRKLTLSIACLLLFFIGAPLGAIIKKGGLGLPVIFSVVFFLIWHISGISGEKMVETGVLSPIEGMWMSSAILFPISLFLTYKAAKDAALFDRDTYTKFIDRVKLFFEERRKKSQAQ